MPRTDTPTLSPILNPSLPELVPTFWAFSDFQPTLRIALKAVWTKTSEDFWTFGYQKYYPSMLNVQRLPVKFRHLPAQQNPPANPLTKIS
jgi:hypothetical protein